MSNFLVYQRDGVIFHIFIGNKGFLFYELPVFIFLPYIRVYRVGEFYLLSFGHLYTLQALALCWLLYVAYAFTQYFTCYEWGLHFEKRTIPAFFLLVMNFILFLRTLLTKSKILSTKNFTLLLLYFIIRYFCCHEMQHNCVADEEIGAIR